MSVPWPLFEEFERQAAQNNLRNVQELLLSCGWHAVIWNRSHTITADFVRANPKKQDEYIAGLINLRRDKAERATLMERCIAHGCAIFFNRHYNIEITPDIQTEIQREVGKVIHFRLSEAATERRGMDNEPPEVVAMARELARSGANERQRNLVHRDATKQELDEYLNEHWDELIPRARAIVTT